MKYLTLVLFLVLGLLGLNSYFVPNITDNIYYFSLAKSLVEEGNYQVLGQYIIDWPPVYPLYLAGWFWIFGPSIFIAKFATLILAPLTLFAIYSLCKQENRSSALLILVVVALLPTGLAMATRISTEWLYMLLSFSFLYCINTMRTSRSLKIAALSGVLLGLATLTRYIGVLLGMALIVQSISLLRQQKLRGLFPEFLSAGIGAAMTSTWLLWIQWLKIQPGASIYHGNYARSGVQLWNYFEWDKFVDNILDVFIQWPNLIALLGGWGPWIWWLGLIPISLMVIGFSKRIRPSDGYVLAVMFLLLFYKWKVSRFVFAISPFLMDYLFVGYDQIVSNWKRIGWIAFGIWCSALFTMDLHLLFLGNQKDFNGLSPLVSHNEQEFYKGKWKEIDAISRNIKTDKPIVGLYGPLKELWIYFYGFSGLQIQGFGEKMDYLIVEENQLDQIPTDSFELILKQKSLNLFKIRD